MKPKAIPQMSTLWAATAMLALAAALFASGCGQNTSWRNPTIQSTVSSLSPGRPGGPTSAGSLQIVTTEMHWGYLQQPYQGEFKAQGGTLPYAWQISSGALPAGLSLNSSTGVISGDPISGGQFSVTVTATDAFRNSVSKSFSFQISRLSLDQYGGLMNLRSPEGGTGHFRVEKFGNRWLFVTPAGHGFFMTGVWGVAFGAYVGGVDELGENYYTRVMKKYGSLDTWAVQTNSRLKSWGFNTIGPYSHYLTYPLTQDSGFPGGTNPVKMPFVFIENITHYAEENTNNLAPDATKSIYRGVNKLYYSGGGDFPDVYDPNFDAFAKAQVSTDVHGLLQVKNSPWLIGVMIDDGDYVAGLGAGSAFPSEPPGHVWPDLGWITLITAPTQATNPFTGKPYKNTTVYAKLALANFLQAKYGSIQELDAAWGANYTTFGSNGGWGAGTGLLDEDGRHSWVGTDPYAMSNTNANVKADLDAFLYQLACKYYSIMRTRLKQLMPDTLYFGPSTTGTWRTPSRAPVIEAASHYVDVYSTSLDVSDPARLNYVVKYLGDKPMVFYEIMYANPDSGRWRYPNQTPNSPYAYNTQGARAQAYETDLSAEVNATAGPTGSIPGAGILYWAWTDSLSEEANFGLVSLMDNAYDGKESTISGGVPGMIGSAACADPWGYPCGAEERNYGDFIDGVRNANFSTLDTAAYH